MSQDNDQIRLQHMLDAAKKIIDYTQGKTRQDLETNEMLSFAILRLLEVVGEAAKGISKNLRDENPTLPWRQIAGTRDRLIHGYFDVDMDVVWAIVSVDIPAIIPELERMLS